MKIIERSLYLDALKRVSVAPDIKVITGIRRCGKSELLLMIKKFLESNKNNNVVHINMNFESNEFLIDRKEFSKFVRSKWIKNKTNYLLVDEVQNIKNFERTINSLYDERLFNIYLTGSNAFLSSSDLSTLFTGRVIEVEVYPFSFQEYCQYFEVTDYQNAFEQYFYKGGFAGSYIFDNDKDHSNYLNKEVITTILERDIYKKFRIRNKTIFKKVNDFLYDNIGNLLTPSNITKTLNSKKQPITNKTIENYLEHLLKSFVFYLCNRFDIVGKEYLATNSKYYLADISLRYALLGTKNLDLGRCLENLVYIELKRRDYEVYVGKLYKKEVDFVILKKNEKKYIQVSYYIDNPQTLERELAPLKAIKDSYEKIIIARTKQPTYDIDGIKIIDVVDWLLEKY